MPLTVSAVGGLDTSECRYATKVAIAAFDGASPTLTTTASILRTLTTYIPARLCVSSTWEHLKGIPLADPQPFGSDPIDLLIGVDLYGQLILDSVRKGDHNQPIAQNTIFGWILSGPSSSDSCLSSQITVQQCSASFTLDQAVQKFWEVEEVPRRTLLSPDDQKCEEHFLTTHSRTPEGQYVVRLPFKRGPPIEISESRQIAERCLNSLHRRFNSQPQVKEQYVQFLQEYAKLRHIKSTTPDNSSGLQYVYIPHHPVLRKHSLTTQFRVVFNASRASSNSSSLNDHLFAGPKLQTDLAEIILRWRLFRYVLSADIEKMYRQMLLDSRDINYQRILWSENKTGPIQNYQLLTVTYGTAAAPYLALRVLRQLVQDEGHVFPLAVPVLRENIYVADLLFGADDIPLLKQIRDQVRSLLNRGHFNLRKWSSNSASLLSDLDIADHGLACHKTLQQDEQVKILGISWNPCHDVLQFHSEFPSTPNPTKRSILSTTAKIFDPLGWATPVTVTAKVLLQRLWLGKLGWNDPIPSTLSNQWSEIHASLKALDGLPLNRWVKMGADTIRSELHGFSDASSTAYVAAVYLRVISLSEEAETSLLIGKSKVASVKSWSIPRLELAAAVLLARPVNFVQRALQVPTAPCYCWTDSTVVLAWLSQHPSR